MLKAFKKKSTKSKIAIIAITVLILALVVYVLYSQFKPEKPATYEMATVETGSITDSLEVSGTVQSGYSHNFIAIDGVVAESVKVSVGDEVKKGDLIATFNVSGASQYLVDAKKDYDSAQKDYNDALSAAKNSSASKAKNEKAIKDKKAEITAKENEIAALKSQMEAAGSAVTEAPIPQEQIDAIVAQMRESGATEEQINAFIAAASSAKVPTVDANNTITQAIIQKNLELSQLNAELASLQAEGAMNISTDNDTYLDALKNIADSKKKTYEGIKSVYDELQNGWYADKDGIITKVNIKPGEAFVPEEESTNAYDLGSLFGNSQYSGILSSLMGSSEDSQIGTGVTLDSYEDLIVSVSVGKADLIKINTGMAATVTSLDGVYEGEITYVAASATEQDGLDISSITGSLLGGSGASGGALVKVKVKNPDKNIVIGFDADVKIALEEVNDILKVPVEAVLYDNGSYYVYIFNEKEGTVKRQAITHGILDDTHYQIISGINEGDTVIKSPDPAMEDGTKVEQKKA